MKKRDALLIPSLVLLSLISCTSNGIKLTNEDKKILEKTKPVVTHQKQEIKASDAVTNRENTILAILLIGDINIFQIIIYS